MSDDIDVVRLVSKVMPLVASYQISDDLAGSCGGALREQGKRNDIRIPKWSWLITQ
jgi:multidrug resistance protein, MATE family